MQDLELLFLDEMDSHIDSFKELKNLNVIINITAQMMIHTLNHKGKVLIAGNGGSAADAQHFAAELSGRYLLKREALSGIALSTDTSALTAIGNDFGFDCVFSRQLEAIGSEGDLFVGISTSGNSANILKAVQSAKAKNIKSIALSGGSGGALKSLADASVIVPSSLTPRIQEAHIFIIHYWCKIIDLAFAKED